MYHEYSVQFMLYVYILDFNRSCGTHDFIMFEYIIYTNVAYIGDVNLLAQRYIIYFNGEYHLNLRCYIYLQILKLFNN